MILLIDGDFLCHRSYNAVGRIYHNGRRLEVPFGVLREASFLIQRYQPESVVWCFDSQFNLRKKVFPEYKANRNREGKDRKVLWKQMRRLRKRQLKMFGFRNIFSVGGYEADDLIAHIAKDTHFSVPVVIVSADGDLKQLLSENVRIYNPIKKEEYTADDFQNEWGILPCMWHRAKAIAGCSSDNIPGVPGVGEKTAIRWIKGTLPRGSRKDVLINEMLDLQMRNLDLVTLPYKGLENRRFKIRRDHLTRGQWTNALQKIGLEHITYPGE